MVYSIHRYITQKPLNSDRTTPIYRPSRQLSLAEWVNLWSLHLLNTVSTVRISYKCCCYSCVIMQVVDAKAKKVFDSCSLIFKVCVIIHLSTIIIHTFIFCPFEYKLHNYYKNASSIMGEPVASWAVLSRNSYTHCAYAPAP